MNILIVDDNDDARMILRKNLEFHDHSVMEASHGEEALKIAKESPPDMIISDILMPVMDGFALCREWKKDEQLKKIPLIFYTATYTDPKDEKFALSLGAERFIIKPMEPDEFVSILKEVVAEGEAGKLVSPYEPIEEERIYLKEYNERLIKKLEDKMLQLKEANKALEHEIIAQKQVEESLRESEQKYRQVFSNVSEAIMIFDSDTRQFLDCNDATLHLYGYSKEEFLRLRQTDITGEPEESDRTIKQTLSGEITRIPLRYHKKKDGTIFPVEISSGKMEFGGKTVLFGVIRDLTERKQAEAEKQRLESQLRQGQKMEAIGTLAGGIAHEFNNILGIIIGNAELAIDDVPEWNPAKECLKEIRAASMRAKDVVRHILSFARKTPAQRKPIQISAIIRDSLKLMRASLPTTIEIRQNISCESEMILADPTEINQILMNLCTNSVHALSEETGVIEVDLESINLDKDSVTQYENLNTGNFVKLTVKDTGQGIDPKIIDRVFDPYFTTKDIGKGTGMGLAVVYGIVKKHDGAIKIQSELGKGTVFEVMFPLFEETLEPEVNEDPEVLPTGTERILIVDDEQSMVRIVSRILKRLGYEVVALLNPKEALELFMAEPARFDLVITDMAMPQMAGDRLAQELMKARPDIPIILCTGHSERINEDRAKELGIKAFLKKPLVTRDFAQTVRKVLDAGRKRGKRDEGREDA